MRVMNLARDIKIARKMRIMSYLGELLKNSRVTQGLSVVEVARLTGMKNLNKQIRVLKSLEEGRELFPKAVLVDRFTQVLQIAPTDVLQAISLDYAAYEAWCEKPVQPYLVIRAVPGFYLHQSLPKGCTIEEGREAAWKIVREKGFRVALVYKHGRAIYFQPDGVSFDGDTPAMQIGRTGRQQMAMMKRFAQIPKETPA